MNKQEIVHSFFHHRVGILATMHQKEKVMMPLLERELGISVYIPNNFNTDCFGTFTRDVERPGSQLDAAKLKAEQALLLTKGTLAISSEGTFGPHPYVPFLPLNTEIVLLIDKENDWEIFGESSTTDTNFNHKPIASVQEAIEFCESIGFPEHAVVVKLHESTKNQDEIIKGINNNQDLETAVHSLLGKSKSGNVWIETDMRAFCNPTRMKNIEKATQNLIEKIYNLCPTCSFPGFELVERRKGLPCEWCTLPTKLVKSELYTCRKCGENEEKLYPNGKEKADPSQCANCNP
ncbi:hypothetical protein JOC85_000912 [Bacillus mesophilus]|uniref:DUF6671 domain-containing protein n=1 Tax=Bacillus mesophilus TaxID=1808955 RepID=A0A6M0QEQ1_9BACI|nr:DUF6671 family protein [Bacillus mesophilus]MBM7660145.1 hypothetical protein [Bacillus mesophilus]NEY73798.1 hypothetical protein [Bacillus mesophilus]